MWTNVVILTLVSLQRLVEYYIAHRNTAKLMAAGGFEVSSGGYPLFIALHLLWLAGLWYLALPLTVTMAWIFAYLVLEAARGWIIAALGGRWTSRILAMPGETLAGGMAGWFRHANYFIVAIEIVLLPLAFGLWWYAAIFGLLNAGLVWWRLRREDQALKALR